MKIEGMKEGEVVVNVPMIEPRLKHDTIFRTFDSLQPGESFIIHNDHDPRPVSYQLREIFGDIFTWEYLQQGPQWFNIRVGKKSVEDEETIGQIVSKDLGKAEVFKKYGIDFCCGGKKTVRQICTEKGFDFAKLSDELRQASKTVSGAGNLNFNDWNLDFLADYVVNIHHTYTRKYMPEIVGYAVKVAHVHGPNHSELVKIKDLFLQVNDSLSKHLDIEESEIFPLIKEIVKAKDNKASYTRRGNDTFAYLIRAIEAEHVEVGDILREIRALSKDYAIPGDACTSYRLLYKMLEEFESDLFTHIHLENNILFPKVEKAEKKLI